MQFDSDVVGEGPLQILYLPNSSNDPLREQTRPPDDPSAGQGGGQQGHDSIAQQEGADVSVSSGCSTINLFRHEGGGDFEDKAQHLAKFLGSSETGTSVSFVASC